MPRQSVDIGDKKHGISGYNYGCRCDICREAKATKRKEYQSSKAAEYARTQARRRAADPVAKAKKAEYDKSRYSYDPERDRWQVIHKKYGMTKLMFEALMDAQGGTCAICKNPPSRNYLSVDHDHACCPGRSSCGDCVRGLLCAACNAVLGRLNDDPTNLVAYLEKYAKER